jgi:hypothetical protein
MLGTPVGNWSVYNFLWSRIVLVRPNRPNRGILTIDS